jgi:hypothetical protein
MNIRVLLFLIFNASVIILLSMKRPAEAVDYWRFVVFAVGGVLLILIPLFAYLAHADRATYFYMASFSGLILRGEIRIVTVVGTEHIHWDALPWLTVCYFLAFLGLYYRIKKLRLSNISLTWHGWEGRPEERRSQVMMRQHHS